MDAKRIFEISEMTKNVAAGKIFVTAFLDFKTYKRKHKCQPVFRDTSKIDS